MTMVRRRPLRELDDRLDQWSRSMIDGTMQGTVKLAKPAGDRARPETVGAGGTIPSSRTGAGSGAVLRLAIPAQTWAGALVLGAESDNAGWRSPANTYARDGYHNHYVSLPVATPRTVTWSLKVDGVEVDGGTTWAAGSFSGVVPNPQAKAGQTWELHADGLEIEAGSLAVHLVDRAQTDLAGLWLKVTNADVWGMTRLGGSWWVTEAIGDRVVEYDDNWTELSSFIARTEVGGVRGITTDGVDLWVTGDSDSGGSGDERVWRYSTAGVLQASFTTGSAAFTGNLGLAFDGTDLWLSESAAREIERWSTAGARLAAFDWPTAGDYLGLLSHDGHLWAVNTSAATLVKMTTAGEVVATVDVSGATSAPTGVWIDANGTLYISEDDVGVWRNDDLLTLEGLA